jgi:hypothetical protein
MNVFDLLSSLRQRNIKLSVGDGQLVVACPKGVWNGDLRNELETKKSELIALLSSAAPKEQHSIETSEQRQREALSFAQHRLWFIDQLEEGTAALNIPFSARLRGKVDVARLEQAFREVIRRHEVLRTSFHADAGEPYCQVESSQCFELTVIDVPRAVVRDTDRILNSLFRREIKRPFDLQRAPTLRVTLVRLSSIDYELWVLRHHITSDGWSFAIICREWSAAYHAFSQGSPSPIDDLTFQYSNFACWQRFATEHGSLRDSLSFWTRQLAGIGCCRIPTDFPRLNLPTGEGLTLFRPMSLSLTQATKTFSRSRRISLFTVLVATFMLLIRRLSGSDEIVLGTDVSHRAAVDLEKMVGLFINRVVLRTILARCTSFKQHLAQVQDVVTNAMRHANAPFEKVVDALHPPREHGRNPFFQIIFGFHNNPRSQPKFGEFELQINRPNTRWASNLDLSVYVTEVNEALLIEWSYQSSLYRRSTVEHWSEQFAALLEMVTKGVDEIDELTHAF